MEKYTVLFNPYANSGNGKSEAEKLTALLPDDEVKFIDITTIGSYADFIGALPEEEKLVIAGGDGTLNRFINDTAGLTLGRDVYYYAAGSGNDFMHDVGHAKGDAPYCITEYLNDLPEVTIKDRTYKFLNGVGYGIDGYCCEVGDELRKTSTKPVNYAGIAIKGLLFYYKPTNAVVTVDGVRREYKKVWLAPIMNGRYYGGGMMPTPAQDRMNPEHTVSVLVWHGSGKLSTLATFPSIFKGEHIKKQNMCEVLTGHEITVEFDRPVAAQVDGETILDVSACVVRAGVRVNA